MIIRETTEHFICTKQPDHAVVSAAVAAAWNRSLIPSDALFNEMLFAVEHHDDAWLVPDQQPIWNDALQQPASFIQYPLALKLHFYKYGLDNLKSDYAKLLCSLHYASFFAAVNGEAEKEFYLNEIKRQADIQRIHHFDEKLADYHFRMLQFCDDISLFICLHEPGTPPENFSDWFRNGFRQSNAVLSSKDMIEIRWRSNTDIKLINSPLEQQVSVLLPYKRVAKKDCELNGLAEAWNKTPIAHASFTIR